ncbi:MAG: hypothetical protein LBI79_06325 [Nitrososphaerota archaeon]|nr:hypothetical protein [Nitrososphaerota archaeon]
MNKQNRVYANQFSKTQKTALTAVMSALIAITTMIAIPLPPPLSTINIAPVIIFTVSILLGFKIGMAATAIGCAVGYLAGVSTGAIVIPPGFLYIYLVGLIAARTPMAFIAGALRQKSEHVGMTLGVIVEVMIFFAIDFALFGIAFAVFDFAVFIDLVFIPVTFIVIIGLRRVFAADYLA